MMRRRVDRSVKRRKVIMRRWWVERRVRRRWRGVGDFGACGGGPQMKSEWLFVGLLWDWGLL